MSELWGSELHQQDNWVCYTDRTANSSIYVKLALVTTTNCKSEVSLLVRGLSTLNNAYVEITHEKVKNKKGMIKEQSKHSFSFFIFFWFKIDVLLAKLYILKQLD